MRLRRIDAGGFSVRCRTRERNALRRVPREADRSDVPSAERHLFPDPVVDSGEDEARGEAADSFRDDWREFVEGDRRAAFVQDLARFEEDVARMQQQGDGSWSVEVPAANVEAWFSALNQARLAMHQRYGFPDDGGGGEIGASISRLIIEGRLEAYLRARLYAAIQEWITVELLAGS